MKYKIMVVGDSALMRRVICDIIESDEEFRVVDLCGDGQEAYDKIVKNSYDAIVLDIVLPKMNGIQLLGKLQKEGITYPIIAISSALKEDAETTIMAMERGAFDFVVKPFSMSPTDKDSFRTHLMEVLEAAVKVSTLGVSKQRPQARPQTRTQQIRPKAEPQTRPQEVIPTPVPAPKVVSGKKIIALACSTGGPQALHEFIPMLPKNIGVPVVIVQHMPAGFTYSLANRLNIKSEVEVKEAEDQEVLRPGVVYIAPGGRHLEVTENRNREACIKIQDNPPVNSLRPCADVMYRSLEHSSYGEVICVVLTGMGADGLEGIRSLQKKKKTYVISESQTSCTVYGMPRAIEQAGIADETVPIHKVANAIVEKLGV